MLVRQVVTVHSSVCVMPVHTKFRLVSGNPPYWAVDTHVYLFLDRNYGSYSDLPSGLPTAEICILQSLDIRSTENPSSRWQPHASSLSMSQQWLLYTIFPAIASVLLKNFVRTISIIYYIIFIFLYFFPDTVTTTVIFIFFFNFDEVLMESFPLLVCFEVKVSFL